MKRPTNNPPGRNDAFDGSTVDWPLPPFAPLLDPSGTFRRIPLAPHQMIETVTPTRDLFVLAHLGVPRVEAAGWQLHIGGLADRMLELSLADLQSRPKRRLQAFHQCAGNPLEPAVPTRRIANVEWGGVDLASLLDELGMSPAARYLWSYGCDHGEFGGTRNPAYLKDLPLARVREGGCLVAYELNGDPLPAEHGFPARLVVPGYYGTNSVKWLYRMTLADRRAGGPFTTVFYNDRPPDSGGDTAAGSAAGGRAVWAVPVESVIVVAGPGQRLGPGTKVEVWGWAWAASGVAEVVVSDDGVAWQTAEVGPRTDWSWQRFRTEWILRDGGRLTLRSRATARDGQVQPLEGARNAVHQVEALVA